MCRSGYYVDCVCVLVLSVRRFFLVLFSFKDVFAGLYFLWYWNTPCFSLWTVNKPKPFNSFIHVVSGIYSILVPFHKILISILDVSKGLRWSIIANSIIVLLLPLIIFRWTTCSTQRMNCMSMSKEFKWFYKIDKRAAPLKKPRKSLKMSTSLCWALLRIKGEKLLTFFYNYKCSDNSTHNDRILIAKLYVHVSVHGAHVCR